MASTPPGRFFAYLDSLANFGIEPSLVGIAALCRALGEPQTKFDVIQVTGTNGKTSTARMVQALLTAHGVKCGLYISPHLERYNERISVDGREIGEDEFEAVGRLVREKTAVAADWLATEAKTGETARQITQFETITAAALAYFADSGVKVAVLEVGMGGRWDATSVAAAKVAVVTNVTMDHADWLGPKLGDIAAEKSFVIKPGGIAVVGQVSTGVEAVFRDRAREQQAQLFLAGRDFFLSRSHADKLILKTRKGAYAGVTLAVAGPWQRANALLAAAAAEAYLGRPLDGDAVRRALAEVKTPGRAELLSGAPDILLDGAHNIAGIEALVDHVRSNFARREPVLLVSILRDKAAPAMVAKLLTVSSRVIFTASDNPRCLTPGDLARLAKDHGVQALEEPDSEAALTAARARAGEQGLVVVTGSLYLVGQVRKILKNQGSIFP